MIAYYFCLSHQQVEEGTTCKAVDRLGPYASREDAAAWDERHEGRHDAWRDQEEAWKDEWDRDDERWRQGR